MPRILAGVVLSFVAIATHAGPPAPPPPIADLWEPLRARGLAEELDLQALGGDLAGLVELDEDVLTDREEAQLALLTVAGLDSPLVVAGGNLIKNERPSDADGQFVDAVQVDRRGTVRARWRENTSDYRD